jgi:hypothetical protein
LCGVKFDFRNGFELLPWFVGRYALKLQPDAIYEITEIQLSFLHPWDKFDTETTVNVNNQAQYISSGFAMLLMDFVSIDDRRSCLSLLDALLCICALVSVFASVPFTSP